MVFGSKIRAIWAVSRPLNTTCSGPAYRIVPSGMRTVQRLVHFRVWVIDDRSARVLRPGVEDECGPGERIRWQRLDVGVAHDQLGERVALELGEHVETGGAGQVVEPVTVLQVLHLALEDVVERRAEETAEHHLLLGQTAHPQVDPVDTGGRDAARR